MVLFKDSRRLATFGSLTLAVALAASGAGVAAAQEAVAPQASAQDSTPQDPIPQEPVIPEAVVADPAVQDPAPAPASTGLGQTDVEAARRPVAPDGAMARRGGLTAAPACPFEGSSVPITLTAVQAQGATQVTAAEIDAAVSDLLNRPSDLSVICEVRDRVLGIYSRRGRQLTRVELPEQRIVGGVLQLRVTEGYIVGAQVVNGEAQGPSAVLAQAYLDKLQTGVPASWPEVERAILLLRELPGADVDVRLRPSTQGPGAVEASATFRPRRRFDLTVGGQRLGSEELGENAVLARIDANSFTPFGERTSLIVFATTNGAQQVVQLLEEVRLGGSGLLALGDIAYGRTRPEGELESLDIEGEALIARLRLKYPVIKTQSVGLNVGGGYDYIDQQNDLGVLRGIGGGGGTAVLFEETLSVFALETDFGWRPARFPGLTTSGGAELRKGVEGLGSSEAGDIRLSREEGRPDFTTLRARVRARYDFSPDAPRTVWVSGFGEAQWADGPLLAYEEFQIGNYTIGRGYAPGAASGDRAAGVQLEAGVSFKTQLFGKASSIEPFVFVDAVRLENDDLFGYESDIYSVGVGVSVQIEQNLRFNVTYAAPQAEPFPNADTPEPRLLASITRAFTFR
jgi:hemolysin activation/secretion protein